MCVTSHTATAECRDLTTQTGTTQIDLTRSHGEDLWIFSYSIQSEENEVRRRKKRGMMGRDVQIHTPSTAALGPGWDFEKC